MRRTTITTRGHRRWVLPVAVPAVGVLAAASAALACTGTVNVATVIKQVNGQPVSSSNPKAGPPGTQFKAKSQQSSQIPTNRVFDLLFVNSSQLNADPACHHSPAPALAQKTSVAGTQAGMGYIPKTAGTVPALTPTGQAAVCFALAPRSNYGLLNTLPDFFTVT